MKSGSGSPRETRNGVLLHAASDAMTPVHTPPENDSHARPPQGHVKGFRCLFDPELDETIPTKERKKLKPRYKNFGEEV